MNGASINDILAKIDQRLDMLKLIDDNAPKVTLDPLSEVGLYLTKDRVLSDLYRQYLNAQRNFIQTVTQHGKDSPMAEIARDMSESCFCAMETRLIELRHDSELTARVEAVQQKQREAYIQDMKARQETYARRGIRQPQAMPTNVRPETLPVPARMPADSLMIWAMLAVSMTEAQTIAHTNIARMSFTRAVA